MFREICMGVALWAKMTAWRVRRVTNSEGLARETASVVVFVDDVETVHAVLASVGDDVARPGWIVRREAGEQVGDAAALDARDRWRDRIPHEHLENDATRAGSIRLPMTPRSPSGIRWSRGVSPERRPRPPSRTMSPSSTR